MNVCSMGGKIAVPHLLPYRVGKFALAGWSEGLGVEVAKDYVRLTTVYPGPMRTGSPRNAEFKGTHGDESTRFLLSDSIPTLSTNADRAAHQIVVACEYGKSQLVVSLLAKLALKAQALFPGAASLASPLTNRVVPNAGRTGGTKKKGEQSTTPLTESWLTTLDPEATKKNNQVSNPMSVTL